MPDFRTLLTAENASFFGHFERSVIAVEMAPKNEASLAASKGQKEGCPDGRWVGRDLPGLRKGFALFEITA